MISATSSLIFSLIGAVDILIKLLDTLEDRIPPGVNLLRRMLVGLRFVYPSQRFCDTER